MVFSPLQMKIFALGLGVHAGNEFDWCFMTPEVFFQGGGDFTQGGAGLGRLDGKVTAAAVAVSAVPAAVAAAAFAAAAPGVSTAAKSTQQQKHF